MTLFKKYVTIQPLHKFDIEVKVNKKYTRVLFTNGGTVNGGHATFCTSDQNIQKALESSPMFGKRYRICEAQNHVDSNDSEQQPKGVVNSEGDGSALNPASANSEGDGSAPKLTFANYNELRDYLVSEHGCTPAEVRTTESALAKAAALKLDVLLEK